MKLLIYSMFAFVAATVLCSCPYSSPYKLDDEPMIYVEDALLGKWATMVKKQGTEKEEPVKMILSKKNATEYNISFTGYIDELRPYKVFTADSVNGSAFMSTVDGNQFLNINIQAQVYIAELKFEDNKLSLLPLAEKFTAKFVQNNGSLRTCVAFHYKTRVRPVLDDDFCLRDMVRVN